MFRLTVAILCIIFFSACFGIREGKLDSELKMWPPNPQREKKSFVTLEFNCYSGPFGKIIEEEDQCRNYYENPFNQRIIKALEELKIIENEPKLYQSIYYFQVKVTVESTRPNNLEILLGNLTLYLYPKTTKKFLGLRLTVLNSSRKKIFEIEKKENITIYEQLFLAIVALFTKDAYEKMHDIVYDLMRASLIEVVRSGKLE